MISRVAESCFWLNRYVERVETLARLLDVNLAFQLDAPQLPGERWHPLVIVTGQEAHFLETLGSERRDDPEAVQEYLTWNPENPSSIRSSLAAARENARTTRETISLEMWETLNDLWIWLEQRETRRLFANNRHAFYARLRGQCPLFHGLAQSTMLHEEPFDFMRLGSSLERVSQTARILDVKHHVNPQPEDAIEMPVDAAHWLATLRSCGGIEPFMKRRESLLSGPAVTQFLLFDRGFPRSVLHGFRRARNFLELVRRGHSHSVGAGSWARLQSILDPLETLTIDSVNARGLHAVLTWIVEENAALGDQIDRDFFSPTVGGAQPEPQPAESRPPPEPGASAQA